MEIKEILTLEQEIFEEEFNGLSEKDQEEVRKTLGYFLMHLAGIKKRARVWTTMSTVVLITSAFYMYILLSIITFFVWIYFLTVCMRLERTHWDLSEKKKYTML